MKLLLTIICIILIPAGLFAGEVGLVINPLMNGSPFALNTAVSANNGQYFFSPRLLRYYISNITFVHDGGQRTPASRVYLLVDVKNQPRYVIGTYDITRIDSIEFHIGVDYMANHGDPALQDPGHPLALQNPSMHWGWSAGYRFITYEGSAGSTATTATSDVQLHSVSDALYRKVVLAVNTTTTFVGTDMVLNAEYGNLLNNIDASFGIVVHGNDEETAKMTENMATNVFSSATPLSVDADDLNASILTISPNPSSDVVTVASSTSDASVSVFDAVGRVVAAAQLLSGHSSFSVATLPTGAYTVVVDAHNGQIIHAPLAIIR
ncbi:MAG: T9SS type A sorting domain-containing protein [Candidatus Kapabacteria bacterium]|nr:T9SS type A sorting domain-containing protein [Candidatus Kapabacteria bacterium]